MPSVLPTALQPQCQFTARVVASAVQGLQGHGEQSTNVGIVRMGISSGGAGGPVKGGIGGPGEAGALCRDLGFVRVTRGMAGQCEGWDMTCF